MKHPFRYLTLFAIIILAAVACKKDANDPSPGLAAKPEAQAAYNAQSGGVYKGVIVGSTGSLKIVLQGGTIAAEVTIDNVTKTLTCSNLQSWTSGQAIDSAVFVNGNWSIVFSVNGDGTGVHVSATIPGHDDITVVIAKETSEHQILAYEGTYSVDSIKQYSIRDSSLHYQGTWNFISYDSHVKGIYRDFEGDIFPFEGTIEGSVINAGFEDLQIHGNIETNNTTGSWETEFLAGTFTGKRKL